MLIVIISLFCAAIAFLLVQYIAKPVNDLYNETDDDSEAIVISSEKISVEEPETVAVVTEEIPKKKRGKKPKAV
jgi:hypothetical protein